jgi:hypothetical protein
MAGSSPAAGPLRHAVLPYFAALMAVLLATLAMPAAVHLLDAPGGQGRGLAQPMQDRDAEDAMRRMLDEPVAPGAEPEMSPDAAPAEAPPAPPAATPDARTSAQPAAPPR